MPIVEAASTIRVARGHCCRRTPFLDCRLLQLRTDVLTSARALGRVKVLDLTRMVSGPVATQTLSDFGATVYKIERRGHGDDARHIGPFLAAADGAPTDESAFYLAYNRGKRSITVDLAKPQGAELVRRLASSCDVLVENFKVGSLAKLGLGYEQISAVRPDIVYCSITGFGQDGPYATRPAYDTIMQAMAGLMSTNGHADDKPGGGPLRTAVPVTDIVAGLHAATAILAALHWRQLTGEGQYIDISMLDSSVALNGHLALEYLMTGQLPRRCGNENPINAPSEPFLCKDGTLMIATGNDSQFASLCGTLGMPELSSQKCFATASARVRHRDELHRMLEGQTKRHRARELAQLLTAANVPTGAILSLDQVFADPQVCHRELALQLPHPRGVAAPMLRSPVRMSGTPVHHVHTPMLGQHTDEVMSAELGLTAEHVQRLRAEGVL